MASAPRRQRSVNVCWQPDGNYFITHQCDTCGGVYYLHAAVNACVDTGRCVSCDNEIASLESWLNADGGLR